MYDCIDFKLFSCLEFMSFIGCMRSISVHGLNYYFNIYAIIYIVGGCPDGSEPVNCKVNPCRVTTCTYFPEATCEADYCGGCNARFFVDKGRQEVTASCATGNELKLMHMIIISIVIMLPLLLCRLS